MNATEFARRRGRIEHQEHKPQAWRTKAMAALIRQAKAVPLQHETKLQGYQLPNGQVVCVKQRYRTEERADQQLAQIERLQGNTAKKPHRAYLCQRCCGWHLTSQIKIEG
jgi:hypothetical protein